MALCMAFLFSACDNSDTAEISNEDSDTADILNEDSGEVSPDIIPDTDLSVVYSGEGPSGIAVDSSGNLYIADEIGHRVLKVSTDGAITTVAGNGEEGFGGDGGPAVSAQLWAPMDVAVDSYGNIYIADELNERIRKVTPEGVISTIAGNGEFREGYSYFGWISEEDEYFDGDPANSVGLFYPCAIAVDKDGNVYFYESGIFGPPSLIQKVSPDGRISTVAGGGTECIGNDIPATSIQALGDLAVDSAGYLYLGGCNCVLEVTPDGMVYTVAGTGTDGYGGDGGLATEAEVSISGMTIAGDGTLYIADGNNYCVRMVTPEGVISTLVDELYRPTDIALAPNGDLFIVERYANRVLKFEAMMTN